MSDTASEFKKIYITNQPHRAEIVMAVLEDHEMKPSMIDKRDSIYLFGDIEVYVESKDEEKALALIKENDL